MSDRLPKRSLLDAGILPVGEIARIAKRESTRPRAAYQSHKWFARRLAATARSLAIAAATPENENFWQAYYGGTSCEGLSVLDPFMGGGVMLLEASRLGANVHGVDVEPVAAAVSSFQGRLPALPDLTEAFTWVRDAVKPLVAPYYETADESGRAETLLHAFWVQQLECKSCGHTFDLHPSHRLAWNDTTKQEWLVCDGCGEVHERKSANKALECGCGHRTKPNATHLAHGKATCPCCGTQERLIETASRTGRAPAYRLFAVETLPAGPEQKHPNTSRRLRRANLTDVRAFERAKLHLDRLLAEQPGLLAEGPIPRHGRSDDRLIQYGYLDYSDIFNARQKLHLGLLARELEKVSGAVGEALRIAFSDHLTTNNMLCAYAGGWRRLTGLFSIRAYRHIVRPVEINPWLEKNGRGTFPNAVRSVQRAAKSLQESIEPTETGAREVVWREPGTWDIRCQDSRDLTHLPDASIDLVLTDPPYFNYIAYSELGHFFVPWLVRFGMIDEGHLQGFPEGQLAKPGGGAAAAQAFGDRLAAVMKEVRRVAKPAARMVFTYQNLDGHGWLGLAWALADAGIRPVRVWPMFGDSSSGLHKRANSISWDCVVLCEMLEYPVLLTANTPVANEISSEVDRWVRDLREQGQDLAIGDQQNLRHALTMVKAFDSALSRSEPAVRLHQDA